jgi:hypothetical protein
MSATTPVLDTIVDITAASAEHSNLGSLSGDRYIGPVVCR